MVDVLFKFNSWFDCDTSDIYPDNKITLFDFVFWALIIIFLNLISSSIFEISKEYFPPESVFAAGIEGISLLEMML